MMPSKGKYTPRLFTDGLGGARGCVCDNGHSQAGTVCRPCYSLYAAAPAMLEALEAFEELDGPTPPAILHWWNTVGLRAIAAARREA